MLELAWATEEVFEPAGDWLAVDVAWACVFIEVVTVAWLEALATGEVTEVVAAAATGDAEEVATLDDATSAVAADAATETELEVLVATATGKAEEVVVAATVGDADEVTLLDGATEVVDVEVATTTWLGVVTAAATGEAEEELLEGWLSRLEDKGTEEDVVACEELAARTIGEESILLERIAELLVAGVVLWLLVIAAFDVPADVVARLDVVVNTAGETPSTEDVEIAAAAAVVDELDKLLVKPDERADSDVVEDPVEIEVAAVVETAGSVVDEETTETWLGLAMATRGLFEFDDEATADVALLTVVRSVLTRSVLEVVLCPTLVDVVVMPADVVTAWLTVLLKTLLVEIEDEVTRDAAVDAWLEDEVAGIVVPGLEEIVVTTLLACELPTELEVAVIDEDPPGRTTASFTREEVALPDEVADDVDGEILELDTCRVEEVDTVLVLVTVPDDGGWDGEVKLELVLDDNNVVEEAVPELEAASTFPVFTRDVLEGTMLDVTKRELVGSPVELLDDVAEGPVDEEPDVARTLPVSTTVVVCAVPLVDGEPEVKDEAVTLTLLLELEAGVEVVPDGASILDEVVEAEPVAAKMFPASTIVEVVVVAVVVVIVGPDWLWLGSAEFGMVVLPLIEPSDELALLVDETLF
ncbi:hypothetical protein CAC42_3242 [Sphaceloma murrayae]|uniref:Uncharacterized protein n=1 Tax=Sphaceloma murrayae TaxID=2082308 RepID=A0A2K1QFU9_9PEZI|nr:hypothetical protein CAC42_3242 [Sphaceloma murrayae]